MRNFMKFKTRRNPETKLPSIAERKRLFDKIEHGSSVTILTPHGNTLSGRAVMLGDYGWVLNAGGRHGTPRLASVENIVAVRAARGSKAPKFDFRSIAGGPQKPWTIKAPRENPSPGHRITGAYCDKKTCFKIASKVSRRGRTYCAGCAPAGSISIDDYNHENALALAARRNPSVVEKNGKTKTLKNLAWLLRHASSVESLEITSRKDSHGVNEADLTAVLRDGSIYRSDFASFQVCIGFVHRVSFLGIPLTINGVKTKVANPITAETRSFVEPHGPDAGLHLSRFKVRCESRRCRGAARGRS